MENIVTLVTQTATHSSGEILLGFADTWYGIRHPFKGAFILNVKQDITAYGADTVKVDNIYGDARVLYAGANQVKAQELTVGMYLLSFDTYEKRLYLVGSISGSPQPQTTQTGTVILDTFVSIGTSMTEILNASIPAGKILVSVQIQLMNGSGSQKSGNVTVWLSDGNNNEETVYSSAELAIDGHSTACISAIVDNIKEGMSVHAMARASVSGFGADALTPTYSFVKCTKIEWVKL